MYLYQRLLMDRKQQAAAITLLACKYEKRHQYDLSRYYYKKAQNFYRLFLPDTNITFDINEVMSTINEITACIIHITVALATRIFFFLWSV